MHVVMTSPPAKGGGKGMGGGKGKGGGGKGGGGKGGGGSEGGEPQEEDEDFRLPGLPRYVRINSIKIGMGAATKALSRESGHFLCPDPKHPGHRAYYRDPDVPDLLVFKPKGQSDVSRIPMVSRGEAIVQQKASCFPAVALAPPAGATVIDTCAAPGNKTCHLAAVMENKGRIFAFELNPRRCELLKQMMQLKGASIVRCKQGSFLDASPDDPQYREVSHVLLDPSCSSSGMSRTPETDPVRLRELAENQLELVLHAMKFPAVQAICYSTCSIHEQENEEVVRAILRGQSEFELDVAMPWWLRRGHMIADDGKGGGYEAEIARSVVRTAYPDDRTIGFFLARFVRKGAERPLPPGQAFADKLELQAKARSKKHKLETKREKSSTQPGEQHSPLPSSSRQLEPEPKPEQTDVAAVTAEHEADCSSVYALQHGDNLVKRKKKNKRQRSEESPEMHVEGPKKRGKSD